MYVTKDRDGAGHRVRLKVGEEEILLGQHSTAEVALLREVVRSHLYPWDDSLEVWVPTPSLLLTLTRPGAPDLSRLGGFRELSRFPPLAQPDLEDTALWTRTTLGGVPGRPLNYSVRREGATVLWMLPMEGRAYFEATPDALVGIDPELFGALGIDRMIAFLRGVPFNG